MSEATADVKSWSEACRLSLAPMRRIQQDGFGALDRFARCQYALAGDFLEWSLALSTVTLGARSPAEFIARQTELGIKFRDQLQSRVQELTKIRSETQVASSRLLEVAAAAAVAPVSNIRAIPASNIRAIPASNVQAIPGSNFPTIPVSNIPTIPVTTPASVTRSPAASSELSAEKSAALMGIQRPALRSTAPSAKPIAQTVEVRMPARKAGPTTRDGVKAKDRKKT